MTNRRIFKDVRELENDKELQEKEGIYIKEKSDNLRSLKICFKGPKDTPYEGGEFEVQVSLQEKYPFVAPTVSFITTVWHPNITRTGYICLDVLKNKWRPLMSLRSAVMSVQGLLESPYPLSPLNSKAAKQHMEDKDLFNNTAEIWTHVFAKGSKYKEDMFQKFFILKESGLGADDVERLSALSQTAWDSDKAAQAILDGKIDKDIDMRFLD